MRNLFKKIVYSAIAVASVTSSYAQNTNYLSNRAPLANTPFVTLPLGTVKADGWLQKQLELQGSGLTGQAETLYAEDLGAKTAWQGGPNSDWEKAPYYVKGLIPLAYLLDDATLKNKAQKYVEWTLQSQRADGMFGPASNDDWWPRMVVIYYMRDYYEATNDQRVISFLTNYFHYQQNNLPTTTIAEWGKARMGDNIEIVLWLYNITGENSLLDLATALHDKAYDWSNIFSNNRFYDFGEDFHPHHVVNVAQALKMPAVYYQKSNNPADREAMQNALDYLMKERGRIDGMFSGDEMLDHYHSTAGTELCATAERMLSNEVAIRILGDSELADQLERVAFNALPAHLSDNYKQHCYYQYPNQVVSKIGSGRPTFPQDYNNGNVPGPYSGFPCCRYNWHMSWPLFVKNMWMGTADNGIAAITYGPSHLTAKVANGTSVTINEVTNYPFQENITLNVNTNGSATYPIKLRIPKWCTNPSILVNGTAQGGVVTGGFYTINRTWSGAETISINFPAEVKTSTWGNNAVGIERGPLVYSLQIQENWQTANYYDNGFSEFEVFPTSAWNYGLVIDRNAPSGITVNQQAMTDQPFGQSPISLKVKAKKVPGWGLVDNGLYAKEPPVSPVASSEPDETITLIPYGNNQLRLSYFPVISNGNSTILEAENANINHASARDGFLASSGKYVGGIDYDDSYVEFQNININQTGMYELTIGYANGYGHDATNTLVINDETNFMVAYPTTSGWGRFATTSLNIPLTQGRNTLKLQKGSSFAEIDYISLKKSNTQIYEAENATLNHADPRGAGHASGGAYVGAIDYDDSYVEFTNVNVPQSGIYGLTISYANGMGAIGEHKLSINGEAPASVSYPETKGWAVFNGITIDVALKKGNNTIRFSHASSPAEIDYISIGTASGYSYEAENAIVKQAQVNANQERSGYKFVNFIDQPESELEFTQVLAPAAGSYRLAVTYANGRGVMADQKVTVNNGVPMIIKYPATASWSEFSTAYINVTLHEGINNIKLTKGTEVADIDYISIQKLLQKKGQGVGLKGEYFNGMNFETSIFSRVDGAIAFDWGNKSPKENVDEDHFSVRWTGKIVANHSENYTFYINSDNGRRLWINGQLIIDAWLDDWGKEYTGSIFLNAGQEYNIKMEYFENEGGASCRLDWSSASQPREVVPQESLFPADNVNVWSKVIQAEDFSSMYGVQVESTTDEGGGNNVGYVDTGDWMSYGGINIPTSGTYTISYRVATPQNGAQLSLDINAGASILGYIDIPNTGGWQNWTTVSHTVYINAGTYNFGMYAQVGGVNINWWSITGPSGATLNSKVSANINHIQTNIFPNPAKDLLYISGDFSEKATIYDLAGHKLKEINTASGTIDLKDLKQGTYILKSDSKSFKFMKD